MKSRELVVAAMVIAMIAGAVQGVTLFEDNFDSYVAMGGNVMLKDVSADWSAPWADSARDVKVGSWWGGRAYFSNSYWADSEVRIIEAVPTTGYSDYTVHAEAWVHDGGKLDWYVQGRTTDTSFVRLGAVLGNADAEGNVPVYARLRDSAGVPAGDYYVATYVATEPIYLDLTFDGTTVTGVVTHDGWSTPISYETSITNAGTAGFGGQFKWGYGLGDFDNFEVTAVPEPATIGLMGLGFALVSLRKKNQK